MTLPLDVARCTGWVDWADERRCEMRECCARFRQQERDRAALLDAERQWNREGVAEYGLRVVMTHCYQDGEPSGFLPEGI